MNDMTRPTEPSYADDDSRWAAVRNRDPRAAGCFVYAVRTTGVYCRPGAAARLPRRENVVFFDTAEQAQAAGYRPSRRKGADTAGLRARLVSQACRAIEEAQTPPTLAQLAGQAGMSAFHFHRMFKAETGLTPKAYAQASRAVRLRRDLGRAGSVTQAIYQAGFNSSSRFYDAGERMLGMRPREYRSGGRDMHIRFAVGQCSLGAILVAQSQRGVCAITLGEDPEQLVRALQDQFPQAQLVGGDAGFEKLVAQAVGLVENPSLGLGLPLDVRGTAFQERVWRALRDIPAGTTISYTQLAERIGMPRAVRAVAQACGANPVAVAIPCHRVVRRDGALSGYRWGIERKRELLRRESQ